MKTQTLSQLEPRAAATVAGEDLACLSPRNWTYPTRHSTQGRGPVPSVHHHPLFDEEGGRIIYFEETYSATFSGNTDPMPRYDYNQIMYRLNLADPRLASPLRKAE